MKVLIRSRLREHLLILISFSLCLVEVRVPNIYLTVDGARGENGWIARVERQGLDTIGHIDRHVRLVRIEVLPEHEPNRDYRLVLAPAAVVDSAVPDGKRGAVARPADCCYLEATVINNRHLGRLTSGPEPGLAPLHLLCLRDRLLWTRLLVVVEASFKIIKVIVIGHSDLLCGSTTLLLVGLLLPRDVSHYGLIRSDKVKRISKFVDDLSVLRIVSVPVWLISLEDL